MSATRLKLAKKLELSLSSLNCPMIAQKHLDEEKILSALSLEKDVDGFHPLNMGNLAMRGREPLFVSCTPKACIELLMRSGVDIMGKNAVVIGRSNIVGLPTSLLLQVALCLHQ
uniref:Tetrahydrofolate dehydrogenase/cyclohydrolase NAD(P)-binding domain-containing protein n=1 Tax=Rhizophora mucronata TaxID=61149 RepID=A0A2P2JTV7_RHIMU